LVISTPSMIALLFVAAVVNLIVNLPPFGLLLRGM